MDCLQGSRSTTSTASTSSTASKISKASSIPGGGGDKVPERERQSGEALPVTKLRFSGEQLDSLNQHLVLGWGRGEEVDAESDFPGTQAASIVERLTQRLLCAVGNLDPRFASKFLITLHDSISNEERTTLEYLVRLDTLSTPVLYPKDPVPCFEVLEFDAEGVAPGFARIRLRNKTSTNWAEFINSSGYLRRDKIQERFVELLALAAAGTWPVSPLDVDDSTLCAAPGKIMDAADVSHVLHIPPEQHVFYGPASSCQRFPDPRDFRLAIVDEPGGIRLRVGFLAPGLAGHDVEVRLLVAVGVDAWPRTTDFPSRVPWGHAECLLFHEVATTGMYLVAVGQQSSSWQIQLPAAEVTLLQHYGPTSTVSQVLRVLYEVLDEVHSKVSEEKCKYHCKLLSRRLLRHLLYHALEADTSSPLSVMSSWTTGHVARHVVRLLDRLVGALRSQHLSGYFFPGENMLANNGNVREEDYLVEANRVYMYMTRLHSLPLLPQTPSFSSLLSHNLLDACLVSRWSDVVSSLVPPAATRSSRFSFSGGGSGRSREAAGTGAYTQYTGRQLDYVGRLVKNVLDVKQSIVQLPNGPNDFDFPIPEDPIEDVIYLLVTIIEQARDHTFLDIKPSSTSGKPIFAKSTGKTSKTKYRTNTKTRSHFDSATAKLVDAVRRDRKRDQGLDYTEDEVLVKSVLRWLYKAVDHSKNSLAPVLRPYLNRLFVSSHEISWTWYLDSVKKKEAMEEINALGAFCRLVNSGEVTPATGLIDSVNKGWTWASNTLSLVSASPLRVIFIPSRGKVQRHILSLPSYDRGGSSSGTRKAEDLLKDKKNATLPTRNAKMGSTPVRNGDTVPRQPRHRTANPTHQELKTSSPMTETFRQTHRRGKHRCAGDLVQALAALNKISILHELSHTLPPPDRRLFLSEVQRLCREHKRQAALRRRCTLPPLSSSSRTATAVAGRRKASLSQSRQVYTPTEEFAGAAREIGLAGREGGTRMEGRVQQVLNMREKGLEKIEKKDTLIGSCRAARIKEDSRVIFHENFKIKSLFKTETT